MTVRFEFELSDVDAENLLDILHSEYTRTLLNQERAMVKEQTAEAGWYSRHAEYIAQLKAKIAAGSSRAQDNKPSLTDADIEKLIVPGDYLTPAGLVKFARSVIAASSREAIL